MTISWRRAALAGGTLVLALATVAAVAAGGANSGTAADGTPGPVATPDPTPAITASPDPTPSPARAEDPTPLPLGPGEEPPQFIVVSFDGGGNLDAWRHWRDVGERADADMTFFLSGTYLLPQEKASLYRPPQRTPGTSEIGFSTAPDVRDRMEEVRQAYLAGHEIGTHFNGHFCGARGVTRWTSADWTNELNQFNSFLTDWRVNADAPDAEAMPFGTDEIVGGRTPCLEGRRDAFLPALAEAGFRYDTSGYGGLRWPTRRDNGMWDIPLQELRLAGSGRSVLSMDYNFYDVQSKATRAPEERHEAMRKQVLDTYRNAYTAVSTGNRAPLILGNHFSRWNEGIYADALTDFLLETCRKPQTRCVSFVQMIDWLEAQTDATRADLIARPTQQMPY